MRALTILKLRLRTLLQSRRLDRELEEEFAHHVDLETQRLIATGMTAADARAAAIRSVGRMTHLQEQCRDERRVAWLTDTMRDLQCGARTLRRTPGFAALAIVILGLGIGANTAVFGVAHALLFRALPVPEPDRLFQVLQPDGPGLYDYGEFFGAPEFREMRGAVTPFAQLAAQTENRQAAASIAGSPEQPVRRQVVSGNYFAVMGIGPAIGRTLAELDDRRTGEQSMAVISYAFWKNRLAMDPAIVGRTVRIGRTLFQIVGVAEPGFFGAELGTSTDLWTPLSAEPEPRHSTRPLRLIGRLLPGASVAQAYNPLQAALHRQLAEMVKHAPPGMPQSMLDRILRLHVKLIPAGGGISPLRAGGATPLLIVFGLVGLVLLLACVTVASLFEARRPLRQSETAVRLSLGASRWRLLRQFLWEAALVAGGAAAFGLVLARLLRPTLVNLLAASGTPLQLPVDASGRVLLFTAAVGALTALVCGLLPAWRGSAVNPLSAIRSSGGRTTTGGFRMGKALVAAQVSVSLTLVLGAASFVRTLVHLSNADTGFDRRNVVVANVQFRGTARGERLALEWKELERQAASIPGVESASLSSGSPFDGSFGNGMLRFPGVAPSANAGCQFFLASPGFFETTGIARLRGRGFEARDFAPGAPPVAVMGETAARQFFAGADPLGKTFSNLEDSPARWVTVIGVAGDVKLGSLRDAPPRIVYYPYTWPRPVTALSIVLRARRDVVALGPALRRAAALANSDFAIGRIATQTKLIDDSLARERMLATAASFFGALSLVMAIIGLYGIASYAVSQRTQEIGIRMALGAARGSVLRMILRESALVVAAGVAIGLPLSLAVTRTVAALLYGVKPYDTATLATTAGFLVLVTIAAALVPAWRAARTDPMAALRNE